LNALTGDQILGAMTVRPNDQLPNDLPRGPRGFPLLPGGYGRSTFAVGALSPTVVRGEGPRIWDDAGNELIDLNNNFTTLVHGHAHPQIVAAAERALRDGASFGLPNHSEVRHARTLLARLPEHDQVRYVNSGTEAVMTALRVARAYTGRDAAVFVRRAYHGSADAAVVTGGSRSLRGVPDGVLRDSLVVPINDVDALSATIAEHHRRVAAIVVDLLPNRAGLIALEPDYVAAVQELCEHHDILLVVDEVLTFRLAYGGLAGERGIVPDLLTVGKLIGGGHPVGAVVGRAEIMSELDPSRSDGLEHGGTFSGNPVTMEAGRVALELLGPDVLATLNARGDRARAELDARGEPYGWQVRGQGSLLRLFPLAPAADVAALQLELWWAAYRRGVLLMPNGLAAVSTVIDDALMDDVITRLVEAMSAVPASAPEPA
jgi:glutamate-1-semialdehyde 2,1-aminomutase